MDVAIEGRMTVTGGGSSATRIGTGPDGNRSAAGVEDAAAGEDLDVAGGVAAAGAWEGVDVDVGHVTVDGDDGGCQRGE